MRSNSIYWFGMGTSLSGFTLTGFLSLLKSTFYFLALISFYSKSVLLSEWSVRLLCILVFKLSRNAVVFCRFFLSFFLYSIWALSKVVSTQNLSSSSFSFSSDSVLSRGTGFGIGFVFLTARDLDLTRLRFLDKVENPNPSPISN